MSTAIPASTPYAAQNRSYYDKIAHCYETMLADEVSNVVIRQQVASKFKSLVKQGRVLDFGGGTGLDLNWLTQSGYQITFCEPSEKMREKAKEKDAGDGTVTFLGNEATDFTKWEQHPPFTPNVDAIISNFAVINCIADITTLFKNLATLINSGGSLMALVLQRDFNKSYFEKLREDAKYTLKRKPLMINVTYGDSKQLVYLHSLNQLRRAAGPWFELADHENIHQFTLLHLVRR